MNLFHRHSFDPEAWKLIARTEVYGDGRGGMTELPTRCFKVYINTCLKCGDLVSRQIDY